MAIHHYDAKDVTLTIGGYTFKSEERTPYVNIPDLEKYQPPRVSETWHSTHTFVIPIKEGSLDYFFWVVFEQPYEDARYQDDGCPNYGF